MRRWENEDLVLAAREGSQRAATCEKGKIYGGVWEIWLCQHWTPPRCLPSRDTAPKDHWFPCQPALKGPSSATISVQLGWKVSGKIGATEEAFSSSFFPLFFCLSLTPTPTTFPQAKVCRVWNRNMTSWVPEWKKKAIDHFPSKLAAAAKSGRRSRSRMNVVGSSYNYNSSKIWSYSVSYLPRFQHCKPFLLAMTHVSTIRASRVTTSATTYRQWSIHHR